ncbi:cytochrome c oxidase assembly protein [Flaviflexus huanghaiensis]|uniref:cytochrome c oxidase assembly protein n=1 Tax=Flaviflexus huanghaiensis TaxID=1111473 RepID=UPI0015F87155
MTTTLRLLNPAGISWPIIGGVFATIIAGLTTGIYAEALLADPGAATRWAVPILTYARDFTAALALGGFLIAATVYSPTMLERPRKKVTYDSPEWARIMRFSRTAAVLWPIVESALLIVTYSQVGGVELTSPALGPGLWQFMTAIELGQIMTWSIILTILVSIVAVIVSTLGGAAWGAALSAVAMVPIALTGHASGAASHTLAVSSMYIHLLAMSAWAGGLIAFLMTASRQRRLTSYVQRYSTIAGWAVGLTVYSGFLASLIRFNSIGELVTTSYGRLLLAKILATGVLALAGLMHRRRTIAVIETTPRPFTRIAVGEGILMAGIIGIAAALGNSAPPVPQDPVPDPSPTFLLSQNPVPPYPETISYLTQWRLEPILALVAVLGIVQYVRWVARLRRRGDAWSSPRALSWVLGMIVFFWITNGGPTVYGAVLFSAHMFMHMMLAMVIPILMVLGAPVSLMARAVPARTDGSRGGREILLAVAHSRYGAFWAHPIIAAMNFAGSLILFYFTGLFAVSLTTHVGHLLMVAHFTLAGYMFANALIGIDPGPKRPPYALRLVLLFATMAFHAFFGIAVISSTSVLANEFFGWLGLPWGVDALADQEVGGAVTWGIGEFPTVALAIAVAIAWSMSEDKQAKQIDRRADRDDDAELKAYNEMLAARARGGK